VFDTRDGLVDGSGGALADIDAEMLIAALLADPFMLGLGAGEVEAESVAAARGRENDEGSGAEHLHHLERFGVERRRALVIGYE
jgi:hypothetical protein